MLNRHGEVFRTLLGASDLALVAASWLAAYGLRFRLGFDAPLGVPEFRSYVMLLALILPLWFVLFRARGLYEAQRTSSLWRESSQVFDGDSDRCRDPRRRDLLLPQLLLFARCRSPLLRPFLRVGDFFSSHRPGNSARAPPPRLQPALRPHRGRRRARGAGD